jgi:glycosyltransferase involved in cell wall biosynthesis
MKRWCHKIEIIPFNAPLSLARAAFTAPHTPLPLQVLYYFSPRARERLNEVIAQGTYDLVHASLIRMAPYVWDIETPTVIDLTDALSRSLANRRAHVASPLRPLYGFEQRRVERYERHACAHFPRLIVCARADADALKTSRVEVVPNAVDTEKFAFTPGGREDGLIVMTGNMGYHPNVDAAVWFAECVWPYIRRFRPTARLQFVGARPAPAVSMLEHLPGVEVTGFVHDVNDYIRRATVSVCPMRCGSGIQNKLLEAMASGAPVVSTSHGNAGVGAEPERDLLIADDPLFFAKAVLSLLAEPERRLCLAHSARGLIERAFTWEQHAQRLEALYAGVLEKAA